MSLSDSLMPDRSLGQQQDRVASEPAVTLTPTERLFARADSAVNGEFEDIFGAGGPDTRASLEGAASTEGRAAYTRFRAEPDAFGTVVGNRERADLVGGALEALNHSKAIHAAVQASETSSVPGYGVPSHPQGGEVDNEPRIDPTREGSAPGTHLERGGVQPGEIAIRREHVNLISAVNELYRGSPTFRQMYDQLRGTEGVLVDIGKSKIEQTRMVTGHYTQVHRDPNPADYVTHPVKIDIRIAHATAGSNPNIYQAIGHELAHAVEESRFRTDEEAQSAYLQSGERREVHMGAGRPNATETDNASRIGDLVSAERRDPSNRIDLGDEDVTLRRHIP